MPGFFLLPNDSTSEASQAEIILVQSLYKKYYSRELPELDIVTNALAQVNKKWLRSFLLKKNAINQSVITRFIVLLTDNECVGLKHYRTLDLFHLLASYLKKKQLESLLFEPICNDGTVVFELLLSKLDIIHPYRTPSEAKSFPKLHTLYHCLDLLLDNLSSKKADELLVTFELEAHSLLQLLLHIVHHPSQEQAYFLTQLLAKILIKASKWILEPQLLQLEMNGLSLFLNLVSHWVNLIESYPMHKMLLTSYAHLLEICVGKISAERLAQLLFEKNAQAVQFVVNYVVHTHFLKPHQRDELNKLFFPCLNELYLHCYFEQLERLLSITLLEIDKQRLNLQDKKDIAKELFEYNMRFANLSFQQKVRLNHSFNILEQQIFSSPCILNFSGIKKLLGIHSTRKKNQFDNFDQCNERTPLLAIFK